MGYIWNIYEKSFTPYFASLAPKHQVHRHKMDPGVCRLSPYWQSTRTKNVLRFLRRYVLQHNRVYTTAVLMCK